MLFEISCCCRMHWLVHWRVATQLLLLFNTPALNIKAEADVTRLRQLLATLYLELLHCCRALFAARPGYLSWLSSKHVVISTQLVQVHLAQKYANGQHHHDLDVACKTLSFVQTPRSYHAVMMCWTVSSSTQRHSGPSSCPCGANSTAAHVTVILAQDVFVRAPNYHVMLQRACLVIVITAMPVCSSNTATYTVGSYIMRTASTL